MSTLAIVGAAFVAGIVLATLFFGVLWVVFRKTLGLVKMLVGWLVTLVLLGVMAGVAIALLSVG